MLGHGHFITYVYKDIIVYFTETTSAHRNSCLSTHENISISSFSLKFYYFKITNGMVSLINFINSSRILFERDKYSPYRSERN